MMQTFKQTLAALLCGAMLFPLASCGGTGDRTSSDTTVAPDASSSDTPAVTEAVTTSLADTHIQPVAAYAGREFRILERTLVSGTNVFYEAFTEGQNGDIVNDAVYKRNGTIEDKHGVKIVSTVMEQKEMLEAIKKDVAAQDNNYDINLNYGGYTMQLAVGGYLLDVNNLEYVDFTQDWWYASSMEETRIAGKNAFAVGDINNQSYTAAVAIFYNRTLGTQYGIEDPYQLVIDGKWTYEKMTTLGREVSADLDGDGWDNEDRYTLAAANWAWQPFFYGQGGSLLDRDENGNPVMTTLDESAIKLLEDVIALVNTEDYCWYLGKYSGSKTGVKSTTAVFEAGQALFWPQLMVGAVRMRNMEMDFGVLPLPKRDETQADYISYMHSKTSLVSVPVTNTDLEFTGLILEDMACLSRRIVRPAFFDNFFDGIIARDEQTTIMLDILWNNIFLDLVQPLSGADFKLDSAIRNLLDTNLNAVVSTYDTYKKSNAKKLETIIEAFEKME